MVIWSRCFNFVQRMRKIFKDRSIDIKGFMRKSEIISFYIGYFNIKSVLRRSYLLLKIIWWFLIKVMSTKWRMYLGSWRFETYSVRVELVTLSSFKIRSLAEWRPIYGRIINTVQCNNTATAWKKNISVLLLTETLYV